MARRLLAVILCTSVCVSCFVGRDSGIPDRPSLLINNAAVLIPEGQRLWKEEVPQVETVDSIPDPLPRDLKHTYYLLRHGQSTANVNEVISSARSLAYSDIHGLTEKGYQQGRESATRLLDLLEESANQGDQVVFVSSPFARARQTAQACLDGLFQDDLTRARWNDMGVTITSDIYYHDLLMERSFGRLDKKAIYTYAYVWPLDRMNVTHTAFDVESVAAVCTRLYRLIHDLEKAFDKTTHVVMVSHADVLQIAQLYAADVPNVGEFSSYRFANGEVRRMEVGKGMDTLPAPNPLQPPKRGTGA